jgi:hypothetical protein
VERPNRRICFPHRRFFSCQLGQKEKVINNFF